MQRMERSFIKNAKERKERKVLLKRTDAQPCLGPFPARAGKCPRFSWTTGYSTVFNLGKFRSIGLVPHSTPCYSTENVETFITVRHLHIDYELISARQFFSSNFFTKFGGKVHCMNRLGNLNVQSWHSIFDHTRGKNNPYFRVRVGCILNFTY